MVPTLNPRWRQSPVRFFDLKVKKDDFSHLFSLGMGKWERANDGAFGGYMSEYDMIAFFFLI